MTVPEGLSRGPKQEFPRGANRKIDAMLYRLHSEDRHNYQVLIGTVRLFLDRFFPQQQFDFTEREREESRAEFGIRKMAQFHEQVTAVREKQVESHMGKDGDLDLDYLDGLYRQGHFLMTHILTADSSGDSEYMEPIAYKATMPLVGTASLMERHVIHDLSIGIGLGNEEVTARVAKKLTRDFDRYFKKHRRQIVQDDRVEDDFIQFLLVADLDYPEEMIIDAKRRAREESS